LVPHGVGGRSYAQSRKEATIADSRFDLALYTLPEAARLARVPKQTLRNWVFGYRYEGHEAPPVISSTSDSAAGADGPTLSFVNLVEALTLSGFRDIGVPLQRVRRAVDYASRALDLNHLLASERILTDGLDLFWEFQEKKGGDLVNLSRGGQKVFPEAVLRYLREIEWGADAFAARWWPNARQAGEGLIVVDPDRAFGAPAVVGTGIRTEDVFGRFSSGESIADLAEDYGLSFEQVESAVRTEAALLEPLAA
jgi:uncharacterized protein (DUF433 family)